MDNDSKKSDEKSSSALEPQNSDGSAFDSSSGSSSWGAGFRFPPWVKIALLGGVVLLASIGYFTGKHGAKPDTPSGPFEIDSPEEAAKRPKVDDFILADSDGKQKKLSDFRGNVVILSFWASWCTPCLVELPTFAELEKKFHDRGLRIVAVNLDEGSEGPSMAKDFWKKEKFGFPCFFDPQKMLAQKFEVEMLPSNFVIDRQGRLALSSFGANDWANAQSIDFLEGLLAEPATEQPAAAPSAESAPQIK